ncbi:MAG TPA: hypothetical protein PKV21_02820 [bacterium]|nr:hypothetical protein [bacterium]HOM26422.1 hypothetical protein [bacterium]
MKKIITGLTCIMFITSFGISLFAAEKSTTEKPKSSATPAQPATPATPATPAQPGAPASEAKVKIQKVVGEITNIDTTANTIKIKKEDGTEITLKATTPKMQEEINKLATGKKVTALYKETKTGEYTLIKISEYKEKPTTEKPKK